ncbi:MAG: allose kinase [Fretibacterium sp.]|nr:allose kinase [Fretibacterium sp.]
MGRTVIGIDIGGTHFRVGRVGADGSVADFRKLPTADILCSGDVLADLAGFIRDYSGGGDVQAVAIGFPATLDRERRRVLQAPNLRFMERLPVVEALSRSLGVPVFAERDVTMALCYDVEKYRIPDQGIVCGIYFGTGIGNAVNIDGRPLLGKNGVAGELGHIPVDGSAIPCGCGNAGCMENLAGGKYLARLERERYPGTAIGELFLRHGGEPLLREFVDRMAEAVATEVNILDPDCVLVGGGVPNMAGFPREYLDERIRFHARKPCPAEGLNVIYTEDEREKSVVGAARYAWRRLSA